MTLDDLSPTTRQAAKAAKALATIHPEHSFEIGRLVARLAKDGDCEQFWVSVQLLIEQQELVAA